MTVKPFLSIRTKVLVTSLAILAMAQICLLIAMFWIITSLAGR